MMKSEMIKELVRNNNGVLRTSDAEKQGISRTYFLEYIKKNEFEKVSKGIYIHPDTWEDKLYLMQLRYSQIIYSHETALYLLDMAEREPLGYTVTVRERYHSKSLLEQGVKVYSVKKELYSMGITEAQTPLGNIVKSYNAERTVCDMVRNRNNVDKQDLTEAIKGYVRRKERNIPLLLRYAKELRIEKIMRQYMEVLL